MKKVLVNALIIVAVMFSVRAMPAAHPSLTGTVPPSFASPAAPLSRAEPDAGPFPPIPPAPAVFPATVEAARARQSIEAVLQKHLDYWELPDQMGTMEVAVEGEWAYGIAEWKDEAQSVNEPLYVLAHRDKRGGWQALLPGRAGVYLQWVEDAPAGLLPAAVRQNLRQQATEMDEWRSAQLAGTGLAPALSSFWTPPQDNTDKGLIQSMRDPAAIYCTGLGYEYQVLQNADGSQDGVCQLPNQTSCEAWRFLDGRCGQAYNVCAREGLHTVTQPDAGNPFSPFSAMCVDANGRDVTSALEAVNLVETLIGNTLPYTATSPVAPSEPAPALNRSNLTRVASFDWRSYGGANWLTPIRDQGMCGSCWAFAAVGVTEAATNIGYRNPNLDPDLSEQYLVTDCSNAGNCAGGWGPSALAYIRDYDIPDEVCLPYRDGNWTTGCTFVSSTGACDPAWCTYCSSSECSDYRCSDRCSNWADRLYSLARVETLWNPSRDEIQAKLLAHGPLAVAISMNGSFDANGVYRCTNPTPINHGVSIVGYNDAGGYWIARNSWGSGWNGDGYFKVAYDNCSIGGVITYADLVACNDENEINDSGDQATAIAYGQTVTAQICAGGDVDIYQFTGTAGDRLVVDIDARSTGSALDSYIYLLDSDGNTVLAENDDEYPGSLDSHLSYELAHDGSYYIRVRDYGNTGGTNYPYAIRLLTDAINPTAEIASPPSNAWLDLTWQTIAASVSDGESGIRNVVFYWHSADWSTDWVTLGEDWTPGDGWRYDFGTSALSEQVGAAFFIYAYDWAGNYAGAASWNLGLDRTPPAVAARVVPMYGNAPFCDFWVLWWDGTDNLSGLANYDVQYRDGADGLWADLVINTTEVYTRFVGWDGHTYYFRARARDGAGNQSAYTGGDGDAQYTVDICETDPDVYEPDNAAGSASWITTDGSFQAHNIHTGGDQDWGKFYAAAGVTYTLMTTHTGAHADTVLYLYGMDGSTLINFNDDYSPSRESRLEWQPSASGIYYAMVNHWDEYAYGCTTGYGLTILTNDTTPPTGNISINHGAAYAATTAVTLTLAGADVGTGVDQMMVSNTSGFGGATWVGHVPALAWTLMQGDGTKTVHARFRDRAGNPSEVYSDTIILDTTAPTGNILIQGGAAVITQTQVVLTLNASDANGVTQLRLRNDAAAWGAWGPFVTSRMWGLPTQPGEHTVWVQFRDPAGNVSVAYSDSVVYQFPYRIQLPLVMHNVE